MTVNVKVKMPLEHMSPEALDRELGLAKLGRSPHSVKEIGAAREHCKLRDDALASAARIQANEDEAAREAADAAAYLEACRESEDSLADTDGLAQEVDQICQVLGEKFKALVEAATGTIGTIETALGEPFIGDSSFMMIKLAIQRQLLKHGVPQRQIALDADNPTVAAAVRNTTNLAIGQLRRQMRERGVKL